MKQLWLKIAHLQKVHGQFCELAKRHRSKCEELYYTNPEQAHAQWELCVFWVERSERVYGKLRWLSSELAKALRAKYRLGEYHDRP